MLTSREAQPAKEDGAMDLTRLARRGALLRMDEITVERTELLTTFPDLADETATNGARPPRRQSARLHAHTRKSRVRLSPATKAKIIAAMTRADEGTGRATAQLLANKYGGSADTIYSGWRYWSSLANIRDARG
jgi:hypothetical protein